ncbi:hypothetical protein [Granulicella sp. dw_53]|uniref:hypothetical protein n=1 Tax=Granulicella sp. dw_53 TaxID=2719792 RepID=UPI001BD37ADB|nr:hypothetical protein [Granulicella sp. dw_53]
MQKWRTWEAAEESDWLVALKRELVLSPLATQSRPGAQRVEESALELGLRRSVVYDLLKRYRQRSQTSSLLPGKRGREPSPTLSPKLTEPRNQHLLFRTKVLATIGALLVNATSATEPNGLDRWLRVLSLLSTREG